MSKLLFPFSPADRIVASVSSMLLWLAFFVSALSNWMSTHSFSWLVGAIGCLVVASADALWLLSYRSHKGQELTLTVLPARLFLSGYVIVLIALGIHQLA